MKHLDSFLLFVLLTISIDSVAVAQNGIWVKYTTANSGLPGNMVTAITFDQSGATWIGTAYDGLAKFNGNWTIYNDRVNVPSNDINALSFGNGNVWIGSTEGLTKTDGSSWTTYRAGSSGLADDGVWAIAPDIQHNMWIGTGSGLNKITQDGAWSTYNGSTVPAFPDDQIASLAPDQKGYVWASLYSAYGMVKFNIANPAASTLINEDAISNFPPDHILGIAVDWAGKVWTAMYYRGVVSTDGVTAQIFSKETDPRWINDYTRAVAVDGCGHVWAGTEAGAVRFDADNTWTAHTLSSGALTNDTVNTIAVDRAGHVWFGTNQGVAEFKPYPEKAWLYSPADGSTITTDSLTSRWTWDCPGIQKYWFELADNPNFTNSHIDTVSPSLTQSASHWDTVFVNLHTYYWRVKAENDAGWGPFSDTWHFTVNKPLPVKPVLLSPSNGAMLRGDSVTCRWGLTTAGVFKYWYEIADNANFTNSHVDTTSLSLMGSRSKWDTIFTDQATYSWRVKALNDVGWGPFSDTWTFTVNKFGEVTQGMGTSECSMGQNHPNPFTGTTTIHVSMMRHEQVSLRVFDVLGRTCATLLDGEMGPGKFDVSINAADLRECGMYVYRLQSESTSQIKTMQSLH